MDTGRAVRNYRHVYRVMTLDRALIKEKTYGDLKVKRSMTPVKRAINHAIWGVGGVGLGLAQEYASRGGVGLQRPIYSY